MSFFFKIQNGQTLTSEGDWVDFRKKRLEVAKPAAKCAPMQPVECVPTNLPTRYSNTIPFKQNL